LSLRVDSLAWFACACAYATTCQSADPLGPLSACRGIAEEPARLACFDRESAALIAASATLAKTAPSRADAKQNFGLSETAVVAREVAAGTRSADASNVDAHITALSLAGNGRSVFTLDNGQIWLQLLTEGDLSIEATRSGENLTSRI
jgi:hypothetical protein